MYIKNLFNSILVGKIDDIGKIYMHKNMSPLDLLNFEQVCVIREGEQNIIYSVVMATHDCGRVTAIH